MVIVRVAAILVMLAGCGFDSEQFGDRQCHSQADCPRPDEVCSAGTCGLRPCAVASDCGSLFVYTCNGGACRAMECTEDIDCGTGNACVSSFCQASFNVASAAAVTNTSIAVMFDAAPDPATATSLASYAIAGLTLSGTPTLSGNTVTLTTSSQQAQSYTVNVTGVTRASDQVALSTATATFTGRTAFDVVGAVATNARSVVVTFDAPPSSTQATTLASYAIADASGTPLALSGVPVVDMATMTTVTLTTADQVAGTYTVTVSGVTRASDAEPLATNAASFGGRTPFEVMGAVAVTTHEIQVTFDAPPDQFLAIDPGNYEVPGLSLGTPTLSGNIVTIPTEPQAMQSYMVTVSNVTRMSDGEPLETNTAAFAGRTPFDVASAVPTTSQQLLVTFDAPPDPTQAMQASNFSIPGLTVIAAGYPGSGSVVTLTTSPQTAGNVTLTVSGVTRASDGEPLTVAVMGFAGRPPFDVTSAAATTSTTFTVTFDAPPDATTASNPANYSVPGLNPVSPSYPGTGGVNTVTLTSSSPQSGTTMYTVTVSNVTRASDGEALSANGASFQGRSPFNVASASSLGNTVLEVTFDAPPDPATATSLASYSITSGSLSLSGTPTLSGNTVTITTAPQSPGVSYTILVTGVVRASDGEQLTLASAMFDGKSGFNVASASSVDATHMSVTYDAQPNAGQATNINNYSVVDLLGNPLALSGTLTLSGTPPYTVTITTAPQQGTTYTVTVTGVKRASDNAVLSNGVAPFTHVLFNVASAAGTKSHEATVTFDALPNSGPANNAANYTISKAGGGSLAVTGAALGLNNTVTLTTGAQTDGASYTVTVNTNVTRSGDNVALTNASATFTGVPTFNVVSASSASSASITVTFDAPPDAAAQNYLYYTVPGLTVTNTPPPLLSGYTVTIATSPQLAQSYTVNVSANVTRSTDGDVLTNKSASFAGTAQTAPTVTSVVVASTNPNNGATFYNTGSATVSITGTQFTGVGCAGIKLDDTDGAGAAVNTAATSCTFTSDTAMTATFPQGIRSSYTGWHVLVTNQVGTSSPSTGSLLVVKAGLLVSAMMGSTGTNSLYEFVEIYNPTATTINTAAIGPNPTPLAIRVRDANGADLKLTTTTVSGHNNIVSHGWWLLVSKEAASDSSNPTALWYAKRDATYTAANYFTSNAKGAIVFNGGVYLSLSGNAQKLVIDKAGWGTQPAGGCEGTCIGGFNQDTFPRRKPLSTTGAGADTDVNKNDFNPASTVTGSNLPKGTGDTPQP